MRRVEKGGREIFGFETRGGIWICSEFEVVGFGIEFEFKENEEDEEVEEVEGVKVKEVEGLKDKIEEKEVEKFDIFEEEEEE